VYPKFVSGAAENLWRAACGPRAALWPPLAYSVDFYSLYQNVFEEEMRRLQGALKLTSSYLNRETKCYEKN